MESSKIVIRLCGQKPLIFTVQDVKRLRCEHHVVGALIGSLPRVPLQNAYPGLPLLLLPEEATLLLSKGYAELVTKGNTSDTTWSYPTTKIEQLRYQIFEFLWSQQFYVTSGLKFGGDFLAYPGDPMRYHSQFIVEAIPDPTRPLAPVDLVSKGRLAVNVKKVFVLAGYASTVDAGDKNPITIFSIQWAGF
ncbi:tRNA intron endonuclease [Dichotomocladium elegans]|nr:tRNA intron endonuclease [Dichotomocladium elegans]